MCIQMVYCFTVLQFSVGHSQLKTLCDFCSVTLIGEKTNICNSEVKHDRTAGIVVGVFLISSSL